MRKKGWYIYARRYLVAGNTSCTAHNAHVNVDDICAVVNHGKLPGPASPTICNGAYCFAKTS